MPCQETHDGGEQKQRDRVEDEDGAKRDGHFFFVGFGNRTYGGDRTASADGGSGGDEEGRLLADADDVSESQAQEHDCGDADGGVEKSGASGVDDFVKIHAEAESND